MQDLNPGSQTPNRLQTGCPLKNRLSYRGSSNILELDSPSIFNGCHLKKRGYVESPLLDSTRYPGGWIGEGNFKFCGIGFNFVNSWINPCCISVQARTQSSYICHFCILWEAYHSCILMHVNYDSLITFASYIPGWHTVYWSLFFYGQGLSCCFSL